MILTAEKLDARRFTQAQCDELFAAVLVDDDVDAHTELPERIPLDFSQQLLADCFRICRQMWKEGVQKRALARLALKLMRNFDLSAEDRLQFKYIRAKFKHLRYAHALYGVSHAYPPLLDNMTIALGQLQDAYKNRRRGAVLWRATVTLLFLTAPMQHLLAGEVDQIEIVDSDTFRKHIEKQMAELKTVLRQDAVTGEQFHEARKIIGSQVSFYDTVRTIAPSQDAFLMSRSLAAINGLMGALHDELVERRLKGIQDYYRERFVLPEEISARLHALVARFPD